VTFLKSKEATLQKKAYKILNAILVGHVQFVKDQLTALTKLFVDTTLVCVPSAKKLRMRCLKCTVLQLGEDNVKFIPAILGDVIMTTRESNAKAREMAETTITAMALKMCKWSKSLIVDVLAGDIKRFFVMIVAGLAGQTPHMIGASLTVLASLIKNFEGKLLLKYTNVLARCSR
jgi:ribosomal RNA-processing protein 12